MEKKKLVVHINNLSSEILEKLLQKYPDGYMNHIIKVPRKNNDFFYAVMLDTEDTSYLIKVDVKIDNVTDDKLSEQLFAQDDIPDVDIKAADDEEDMEPPLKLEEDTDDL